VQQPHPPIYMAAYTEAAMNRVARFANGWMPVGVPVEGMTAMLAGIREMADSHGRDGDAIELIVRANVHVTDAPLGDDRAVFSGTLDEIRADVEATREAGAAELTVDITFDPATRTPDDYLRGLDTWLEVAKSV
jgi:alkanesulfonate monooxygenase SsuD/methylene tetrahydromethanopterin reductase-like flavin-dependent oxidoreductase (luciferase family)